MLAVAVIPAAAEMGSGAVGGSPVVAVEVWGRHRGPVACGGSMTAAGPSGCGLGSCKVNRGMAAQPLLTILLLVAKLAMSSRTQRSQILQEVLPFLDIPLASGSLQVAWWVRWNCSVDV